MDFDRIMQLLAHGDQCTDWLGRSGKLSTVIGTAGFLTTANLAWLAGVIFGAATLVMQVWWEWYRAKRRAYIDTELYKARRRKEALESGLDISSIRALKESPDPDAE